MAGRPWHHLCAALRSLARGLTANETLQVVVAQDPPTWTTAAASAADAAAAVERACSVRPHGDSALAAALSSLGPAAPGTGQGLSHLLVAASTRQHLMQPADPAVAEALRRWLGPQRTVSTLLVGPDADPGLIGLSAPPVAAPLWWARDPSQLAETVQDWRTATADTVATALDVRVYLAEGVQLRDPRAAEAVPAAAAATATSPATAQPTANRPPLRWQLPWLRRGDQHDLAVSVRVAAGSGRAAVARVDFAYRDEELRRPARHVSQRGLQREGTSTKAAQPAVLWSAWMTATAATLIEASAARPGATLTRSRDALRAAAAEADALVAMLGSEAARSGAARLRAVSVWADRLEPHQLRTFQAYCHLLSRRLGATVGR
jgi:hypothetical protein